MVGGKTRMQAVGRWAATLTVGIGVCLSAYADDAADALAVPTSTQESIASAKALTSDMAINVEYATQTTFDTTPPATPTFTSPAGQRSGAITVSFSNAVDTGGSGNQTASLWMKNGTQGTWTDTGVEYTFEGDESEGTLVYEGAGEGDYYFFVRLQDRAGNFSDEPTGDSTAHTVVDDSGPVLSLIGPSIVVSEQGSPFNDPGATATDEQEGDISANIVVTGTVNSNVAGSYTLAYNVSDSAGNPALEVQRTVSIVEPSAAFGLDIEQPNIGGIVASPSPNAANNLYLAGTAVTLAYASAGNKQVASWNGAIADASDKNRATILMDGNKFVSVNLEDATGTVRVDVTPDSATWVVTDSAGDNHNGAGDSSVNVATGQVSIEFNDMDGYTKPNGQSDTVAAGGILDFAGLYLEGNSFNFTAPRSLRGQPGSIVECPINIDKGEGIRAFSFSLSFDDSLVEVDRIEPGNATSAWGQPSSNISAGSISASAGGPALASGGTLAKVFFRVKDDVTESSATELTFGNASLTDGDGAVDNVNTNDGKLSVELGEFTWGDANADNQVDASDANLLLQYSVGLIDELPAFAKQDPSEGTGGADVSEEDPSVVGAYDAALVLQHFAQSLATFPADRNGDGLGPDLTEEKKLSGGAALLAELDKSVARTVKMTGSQTVSPNTSIEVPIGIDIPDRVQSYKIIVGYDPAVLSFDNVGKGATTETWLSPVISHVPGQLTIASAGADSIQDAGAMVKVSFLVRSSVAAGTVTDLSLVEVVLNDGNILATTQDEVFTPELSLITPARGADFGGTVVVMKGSNLADVDAVFFGSLPSSRIEYLPEANLLTAVAPEGVGTVDVTVSSLGQSSTMSQAYSYFAPDISVYPDPESNATMGANFDVPMILGGRHAHSLTSVSFTLHFDPRTFTIRKQSSIDEILFLGPTATRATISGEQLGRDKWRFTIDANLGPGHFSTVRLLTSGRGGRESIIYVTDVEGS